MATAQCTRPCAVVGAPRRTAWQLKVRLDWTRSNAKRREAIKICHRQDAKGCNRLQPLRAVALHRLLAGCSKITY